MRTTHTVLMAAGEHGGCQVLVGVFGAAQLTSARVLQLGGQMQQPQAGERHRRTVDQGATEPQLPGGIEQSRAIGNRAPARIVRKSTSSTSPARERPRAVAEGSGGPSPRPELNDIKVGGRAKEQQKAPPQGTGQGRTRLWLQPSWDDL